LLVGANFHRLSVPKGVAAGADFSGSTVPTDRVWTHDGIGLFLGRSLNDNVFEVLMGRLGK
jgi:hypothetical protein